MWDFHLNPIIVRLSLSLTFKLKLRVKNQSLLLPPWLRVFVPDTFVVVLSLFISNYWCLHRTERWIMSLRSPVTARQHLAGSGKALCGVFQIIITLNLIHNHSINVTTPVAGMWWHFQGCLSLSNKNSHTTWQTWHRLWGLSLYLSCLQSTVKTHLVIKKYLQRKGLEHEHTHTHT